MPSGITLTYFAPAPVSEGPHTGLIRHSATGSQFDGLSIRSVAANVTGNDYPVAPTVLDELVRREPHGGDDR